MKRKPQTISLNTLVLFVLLAVVAVGSSTGCHASGYPAFVKLTPDARYVIYQDGSYPKTYVYDVQRSQKTVFDGRVACMNKVVSRLVVRGEPSRSDMKCWMITLEADGPKLVPLPVLPMSGGGIARLMFIEGGPGLVALLYDSGLTERPAYCKRLEDLSGQWAAVVIPPEFRDQPLWAAHEPIGDRLSGYVYSPRDRSFDLPESQLKGLGVQSGVENGKHFDRINSPDRTYVVTIRDSRDVWRRVWLTETADSNRVLLLDKNDALVEVVRAVVHLPAVTFVILFGPPI